VLLTVNSAFYALYKIYTFTKEDETLEQVSHFTYFGCSISYQFFNDVEFKLAKFLQLIGTI
jgi:hypothetical protein